MNPNCEPLSRPGDEDYWRLLARKVDRLRIPFSGGIALTHRCNLRCVHCYAREDERPGAPAGRELSARRWKELIDEIKDAGCLLLLVTGGEPLLRPDFADIYTHIKRSGFLVTLFTNGTLLTEETAALLADLPPRSVEISLYGATPETHDRITGVAGSFARALKSVEMLKARDIPVAVKSVVLTLNDHEFPALNELAGSLGADFRVDAALFPGFTGDRSPLAYRVSPERAVAVEFADSAKVEEYREFLARFRAAPGPEEVYPCSSGVSTFHIDPHGELYPCLMVRKLSYPLGTGQFRTGWDEVMPKLRDGAAALESGCRGCKMKLVCGYCPGFFEMENGDDRVPSEYTCALGRLRFDRLNRDDNGG